MSSNSLKPFIKFMAIVLGGLFLIMFIDGTYGAFIHIGENLIKDGRLGFLNKIILLEFNFAGLFLLLNCL